MDRCIDYAQSGIGIYFALCSDEMLADLSNDMRASSLNTCSGLKISVCSTTAPRRFDLVKRVFECSERRALKPAVKFLGLLCPLPRLAQNGERYVKYVRGLVRAMLLERGKAVA